MFYKLLSLYSVLLLLLGCNGGWPDEKDAPKPKVEKKIFTEDSDDKSLPIDSMPNKDCRTEPLISGTQCEDGTIYVGQIENQHLFTTPPINCPDLSNPDCMGTMDTMQLTFSEAINFCEDLNFGGFDDWAVPDIFELTLMVCRAETAVGWRYRYPQLAPNCELFGSKTSELKGFMNDYYWSKTETLLGVFMTSFGEGDQTNALIFGWSPVRCTRKSFITPAEPRQ